MSISSISNSIIATSSGVIGGLIKAISSGFATISISHITEVIIYAAISAFVGYIVKLGVDSLRNRIFNKNTNDRI